MSLREGEATVDILCEFLEVAIHNILYIGKLALEEYFEKRVKYGVEVYQCIRPNTNKYINKSLKSVRIHANANQFKRLIVCLTGSGGFTYERFFFDVVNMKNSFQNDPVQLKLEQSMREFCLKLHTSTSYLPSPPEHARYIILLYSTKYSSLPFIDEPAFDDYPWIPVGENQRDGRNSEKECKLSVPDVVPIHILDIDSLHLQVYYITSKSKEMSEAANNECCAII